MDRRAFLWAAFGWVCGTVGALLGVGLGRREAPAADCRLFVVPAPSGEIRWSSLDYRWDQYSGPPAEAEFWALLERMRGLS